MNTFKKLTELRQIISKKKTAVCLSLDINNWQLGRELVHLAGNYICMLKIHPELIEDWTPDTRDEIKNLAIKYDFQIMCDQKMADVPKIVERQICSSLFGLSDLADWITIMPNNYLDVASHLNNLPNPLPPRLLLVAQMNTQNSLGQISEFQNMINQIITKTPQIGAVITQVNSYPRIFGMTPGVILNDTFNPNPARYRDIQTAIIRDKNNVVILGDAILQDLAKLGPCEVITDLQKQEFKSRAMKAAAQSWEAIISLA